MQAVFFEPQYSDRVMHHVNVIRDISKRMTEDAWIRGLAGGVTFTVILLKTGVISNRRTSCIIRKMVLHVGRHIFTVHDVVLNIRRLWISISTYGTYMTRWEIYQT